MATASQPLSQIVDITTTVSAAVAAGPTYNTGCIIGPTRIVGVSGVPARVTEFASTAAMITFGYGSNSPEVLAAQNYFSTNQKGSAPPIVYIGLQDGTAIATATIDVGGENYVVGDVLSVTQSGAQNAQLVVSTVAAGVITGLTVKAGGTGFSVATGLPTTGGSGTGATVNVTAIGETPLQAVEACRAASGAFYGVSVCNAAKADILAIMSYCESATPDTHFFAVTADADALAASNTSVIGEAMAGEYENSTITYSTTQGGAYPPNTYMGARVMGLALGLFTGLAGSYYTLNNNALPGVYPEPLTLSQATAIKALNANLYLTFGNNQYNFFQPGITPSGTFFDQVIFTKAFVSDLQTALVGVIAEALVIAQTDIDEEQFLNAATSVCEKYVQIGWIAPGKYEGATISGSGISITNGQSLSTGYSVQAASYSTQSQADRDARQAMPVYVFLTLAGAVHSLSVGVSITL